MLIVIKSMTAPSLHAGFSLGGYLAAVACSGLANRIEACVVNPGITDLTRTYNVVAQYGIPTYGALHYVAQQDPDLLPSG